MPFPTITANMCITNVSLMFDSNPKVGIRNTFGYIRSSSSDGKQPPISRPNGLSSTIYQNGFDSTSSLLSKRFGSNTTNSCNNGSTVSSIRPFSSASITDPLNMFYEKWSIGGSGGGGGSAGSPDSALFTNGNATLTEQFNALSDPVIDLSTKLISASSLLPIKSQIKRQKMIYHCKFGEFGVMEGQFTEPSGNLSFCFFKFAFCWHTSHEFPNL